MKLLLGAGLALALGCAATGCVESPEEEARSQQLLKGAEVFRNRCSLCHGDRGSGDGPLADVLPVRPRNYHADPFKWGSTPHAIAMTIRQGRSGVMPPFEGTLDETEILAVTELVADWAAAAERERAD